MTFEDEPFRVMEMSLNFGPVVLGIELGDIVQALRLPPEDGAFLDPVTHKLYLDSAYNDPKFEVELASEIELRPIPVPDVPSFEAFTDMEEFARSLDDEGARVQLDAALRGKKPFRRFRDTVHQRLGIGREWTA